MKRRMSGIVGGEKGSSRLAVCYHAGLLISPDLCDHNLVSSYADPIQPHTFLLNASHFCGTRHVGDVPTPHGSSGQ